MSKKEEKKNKAQEPEQPEKKDDAPEDGQTQTAAPEKTATETLKASLAEANDKYLRADTVSKFLPVYDNLARAAQHETDDETRKGVEGILNQFKAILEGLGVTEIETVGKKFDANLHDALLHIEDEKYGEGEIVLELEKGFKLGDKVIRFAKVQVAN